MKLKIFTGIALLSILALLLGACGPTPSAIPIPQPKPAPSPAQTPSPLPTPTPEPSPTPSQTPAPGGTLQVYVTDAPPREQVTSIMVTVSEVQVHIAETEQEQEQAGSANQTQEQEMEQEQDSEGKWITINLSDNTTFDLLQIIGIEQYLGASQVAAGKYTQVRLVVDTIQVALGDGELQDATVPSNTLKIVHPFKVTAGETTALVLDFEADKMVTVTGSDKIIVKPVVKLSIKQKGPTSKSQEVKDEETEEEEFRGTIETIDGTTWTMNIDGETRVVDVSNAEIEGEPAVGLKAEVEGVVVDDTIIAEEVEIIEAEEEE